MSIEVTIIIVTLILFVAFPIAIAVAKKIEPITYNKDVIKKAYKLIQQEQELRIKQNNH